MKINRVLLIGVLLIGFSSCLKHKSIEPIEIIEEDTTAAIACGDTVFFSTEIMAEILTPSCNTAGCHNSSAAGGYDFLSYSEVNSNANIILSVINHDNGVSAMPLGQPKLNDSLITKFDCWMQQGQLNN